MTYLETQLGPQNLTIGGPPWIRTWVSMTETPLDREPSDRDLPLTENPPDRPPPPDRDPPGQTPPDRDPPGQRSPGQRPPTWDGDSRDRD